MPENPDNKTPKKAAVFPSDKIRLVGTPKKRDPNDETGKTVPVRVTFDSTGKPVFMPGAAEPAIADTRFAKLSVESGLVTPDGVRECLTVVSKVQELGVSKSLSEALVEKGYLTQNQALAIAAASRAGDAGGLLAGFQLMEKLGEGGMGTVYRARQVSLDRLVALKILPERLTTNAEFVARFERESKIAAKLSHPNIVGAVDAGFSGGKYYFAMEYIDGPSLKEILAERGTLPVADALDVMVQMATALEYAGRNDMVHRDIKPDNIMFTSDGTAKLADLGLAKERGGSASDSSLTQAGMGMGSPHYIAPEQAVGNDVDIRADIYALGVTFYETVTGRLPFSGMDATAIIMNRFQQRPRRADEVDPNIPREVADVIDVMMAHDAKDRYPDPRVLVHDLALLAGGDKPEFASSNEAARRRAVVSAESMDMRHHTSLVVRKRTPWSRIAAAVAAAVIVLAGGAFAVMTYVLPTPRQAAPAAREDSEAAKRLAAEAASAANAIDALVQKGEYDEAIAKLDEIGGAYDATPARAKLGALRLDALRRKDEAKRDAEERAASEKRYGDLMKHARDALAAKDYAAAIGMLVQAQSERDTDEVKALMRSAKGAQFAARADDAARDGSLGEAVSLYELALKTKANDEVAARLAKVRDRAFVADRIETAARLTREERYAEAKLAYGQARARAGDDDARKIDGLLAGLASRTAYLNAMGAARRSIERKEWKAAIAHAEKALATRPGDEMAQALIERAKDALGPEPRITNSIGMELVLVPAGAFEMGSAAGSEDERPVRSVYVDAYYVGVHEVTNEQYEEFSPGHRSKWKKYSPADSMPVIAVTWEEAAAFCAWLSKKEGVTYRLPTEAEWEKAARGTDRRTYPWGDEPPLSTDGTWRCNLAPSKDRATWRKDGFELAAPVGRYPSGASPYGALDMAGNVYEWCADWYAKDTYATGEARNPTGPERGEKRAIRGGSFTNRSSSLRSANRLGKEPGFYEANLGFRVVRVPKRRARSE